MPWQESPRDLINRRLWRLPGRSGLRRAALRYAKHGWDVIPGAWLTRHGFRCGRPSCQITSCHPAFDDWERSAGHERKMIARWWRYRAHAVLLATGRAFDVLEISAAACGPTLSDLPPATFGGPVLISPGRWMFLTRPGNALAPRLASRPDVVLHGRGSWIPAPPTRQPDGPVRWWLPPGAGRCRLADPDALQSLLIASLSPPERPARPTAEPASGQVFPPGWEPVPGLEATIGAAGAARRFSDSRSRNGNTLFTRTARSRLRRNGHRVA